MAEQGSNLDDLAGSLQDKAAGVFARALNVGPERKVALLLDLSRAATLKDLAYWLQIFFSTGIATLGLVLNSSAVIIGAMLISPLMYPIFASGLALATGDLVLAIRGYVKLLLSCVAAVAFAALLVVILPFREMTSEIISRTQPNVLDLLIALFSGAVGSVAICREVKGVVTSIPGVAIAVALMPPLSVVGYGIALMLVFDPATGWRVASGGGLLFLTNLVTITLTAMLVFMALRIDTEDVRARAQEWEESDPESLFVIRSLHKFPGLETARKIHSVPLRLAMILLPMVLILVPLSTAFNQLRLEIAAKQRESRLRNIVTGVWQQRFQADAKGRSRSSVDHLEIIERNGTIDIRLRVFDDTPYTADEKQEYTRLIAERLGRPSESIRLRLTEIPTVSVIDSLRVAREETRTRATDPPELTGEQLLERFDRVIAAIKLPFGISLLRREIVFGDDTRKTIRIYYLSGGKINNRNETALAQEIGEKLDESGAGVVFQFIPSAIGDIDFNPSGGALPVTSQLRLDRVGALMNDYPGLSLAVSLPSLTRPAGTLDTRYSDIARYLGARWQIGGERLRLLEGGDADPATMLKLTVIGTAPTALDRPT